MRLGLYRRAPRAALLVLLCALAFFAHGRALEPMQRAIEDARLHLAPRAPTGNAVVVAIDPSSLEAIDAWPWPRRVHALLVDELNAAGVRSIHFDVDFSSPSNEVDDTIFADALARSAVPATLAAHGGDPRDAGRSGPQPADGDPEAVERLPIPPLAAHAGLSSVMAAPGADGLVREAEHGRPLSGRIVPSLATRLAGLPGGAQPEAGGFAIDFSIDPSAVPVVSLADVLTGDADPALLAGRDAVIGATAIELGDMLSVPNHAVLPGAIVQVLAAETLSQDRVAVRADGLLAPGLALVLLAGWWLLGAIERRRLDIRVAWACLLASAVAVALAGAAAQILLSVLLPTLPLHLAIATLSIAAGSRELLARRNAARDARRVLKQVVTDNFDAILVFDETGRVRHASHTAEAMIERMLAPTSRVTALDAFPTEWSRFLHRPARLLREGRWRPQEPRMLVTKDRAGTEMHLEYVVTPSLTSLADGKRIVVTTLTLRDVSEAVAARARTEWLARHDSTSGALERHALEELIKVGPALPQRVPAPALAPVLVALEVTRLPVIRETLGAGRAEAILKALVARLEALSCVEAVARTGERDFVVLGTGRARDPEARARTLAAHLRSSLLARVPRPAKGSDPTGAADAGKGSPVAESLVRIDRLVPIGTRMPMGALALDRFKGNAHGAVAAVLLAKGEAARSGEPVVLHDPEHERAAHRRRLQEMDLPGAIAADALTLSYQPQIDLASGDVTGIEALVRWTHPELGFVPPDEFVAVAEASGTIAALGAWVLERACRDALGLVDRGVALPVSVNVSPQQFVQDDMEARIGSVLAATGLPPERLELEITESAAVQDPDLVRRALAPWRERGVRVALDDFGTGYAQLSALRDLPLDKLKIDRSLVMSLPGRESSALVAASVAIARGHGLGIVAEGIEDARTGELLRLAGCDIGQGYHWSKPLALRDLRGFLAARSAGEPPKIRVRRSQ